MDGIKNLVRRSVGPAAIAATKRRIAPLVARDLTRLGRLYGTDKAYAKHFYTPYYQRHFEALRKKDVRLLEIGIGGYSEGEGGSSLRMWRSYFPDGEIHGLDLYPKQFVEPRITTHQASQADAEALSRMAERWGPFDIIIDDGSHVNEHIRISFAALFPRYLRPGGWYVIEDLATAYDADFGGGPPGTDGRSVSLISDIVDQVQRRFWDTDDSALPVGELHVYEQITFIKRSP